MLGTARASQYAAFWNTGLDSVDFSSTSTLNTTSYQTPQYAFLTANEDGSLYQRFVGENTLDLTGLTGFTGFNNLRSARIAHVYLPSSTWGSLSDSVSIASNYVQLVDPAGSEYNFTSTIGIGTTSSVRRLQIQACHGSGSEQNALSLTGAYTQYLDRWLTLIVVAAETSTVYTSWTGGVPGTKTQATRACVFDQLTGDLLGKEDFWRPTTTTSPVYPTLSGIGNTVYFDANTFDSATIYRLESRIYSAISSDYQVGGMWFGLGTMFDPLSETNTSWRTAKPAGTIGNARAWVNWTTTSTEDVGFDRFAKTVTGDLVTAPNSRLLRMSNTGARKITTNPMKTKN